MLDDQTARGLLDAYHQETTGSEEMPPPLLVIHGIREEVTVRPNVELPSAYHMAAYVHPWVGPDSTGITVVGRFFKQIGTEVFQGTVLYHVDRIGSHLIRGIDSRTSRFTILDDSPYWRPFPYDFDTGPQAPDMPIGFHPGPALDED